MTTYKMLLQYDGTNFSGWQKQGNTDNTIQQILEQMLSDIVGYIVEINGAGRTDAGVHAAGQCASFKLKEYIPPQKIITALSRKLPSSIGIMSVETVTERFHARLSARGKTYQYRIRSIEIPDVFTRRFVADYSGNYSVPRMREAAAFLIGTHDFAAFCGNKHMKKSTVRTVKDIQISEDNGEIRFLFTGDGFLMYMVRIMTGTLLQVGAQKMEPAEIREILDSKNREKAGPTAPAKGLCLMNIDYSKDYLI